MLDREFLQRLGHPIMVCHGPQSGTQCPLLIGESCELAEGAHGIVFGLDLDKDQHRGILHSYKDSLRSDLPIRVAMRPGQATKYAHLVNGLKVWTHSPVAGDLDGLAAEVDAADQGPRLTQSNGPMGLRCESDRR